jgi:hypothetical protein
MIRNRAGMRCAEQAWKRAIELREGTLNGAMCVFDTFVCSEHQVS